MKHGSLWMGGVALFAIAGLLVWALAPVSDSDVEPTRERRRPVAKTKVRESSLPTVAPDVSDAKDRKGDSKSKESGGRRIFVTDDKSAFERWAETRAPADAKLAKRVAEAIDNSDLKGLQSLQDAVLKCKDPEIRGQMVEALSWFGASALPDMTPYLSDADSEVRESALGHWESWLDQMNGKEAVKSIAGVLPSVTEKSSLDNLTNRLAESDEPDLAVSSIIGIVGCGNGAAAKAAEEAYEKITGEKYESEVKARFWLWSRSINKKPAE